MSYSFNARGASLGTIAEKVHAELTAIVAAQPIHAADRSAVWDVVLNFINMLPKPNEKQDYYVSVSGSVGWDVANVITAASVSVSAHLVNKEAA